MSRNIRFARLAFTLSVVVLTSIATFANSHVRIVRLSSVEGHVQMDRGNGAGPERAILNAPIVEGTRLVTGSDGLAEVEFENESALRITDNSEIKFSQLLMNDAGAKINQFEVVKGIVYLDTASKGDDVYRVKVGDTTLLAHRDSMMRISATREELKVAVFKGNVQLEGGAQPVEVKKKETLTVDLNDASKYTVANGTEAVRYDAWNKEREDYSRTYAENTGYGGPNRAFGLQDLNYYGDYFYASGYGYAWQPYGFAGSMLNWSPYSNGAWMFYPGMGYAWASAYPWGWLPFHYGSWAFINGAGWAWLPGGGYNGGWYAGNFRTVPAVTRAPAGWTAATPPALLANSNTPRTVFVGGAASANALTIPGGRIPPSFGSLVPGHSTTAAAASGFIKPNVQTRSGVNEAALAGAHAGQHVYAARQGRASSLSDISSAGYGPHPGGFAGPSEGLGRGPGPGSVSAAHASSSAAHK